MAVIDVAGFVADLKSQAIDHGFHVHDERHFVETYSLRQPPTGFTFPLLFTWTLPPLSHPPDLLVLATEVAGVGGLDLPVEVAAIDSFASVTDAAERSLSLVARISVDLADVYLNHDGSITQALDRCKHVSLYLLERADAWLDSDF